MRVLKTNSPQKVGFKAPEAGKQTQTRDPDHTFTPATTTAPAPNALDGKLQGAWAEVTEILSATDGDGHWKMLDGATPAWTSRQLLDVQGRFGPLSMDPAKGKVSPGTVEEAGVGLSAERAGVVPGPITREPTGQAEFIDGKGKFWDVKSPVSPWEGARWTFDAQHQVEKVKHDISQDNNVLLNTSRLTPADLEALLSTLRAGLTDAERARVFVMTTAEVLHRE